MVHGTEDKLLRRRGLLPLSPGRRTSPVSSYGTTKGLGKEIEETVGFEQSDRLPLRRRVKREDNRRILDEGLEEEDQQTLSGYIGSHARSSSRR